MALLAGVLPGEPENSKERWVKDPPAKAESAAAPALPPPWAAHYSARSHSTRSLFWISSSFQKINKNILEAPGVSFLAPSGPPDPALSFPTIEKIVGEGPRGPGAAFGGVGGERWGSEGEGGGSERRAAWAAGSRSRGAGFKK